MPEAFLLAAGASRRMGASKPLMAFGDSTVLATMARAFLAAGCRPVSVVHRLEDVPLLEAVRTLGLRAVANADPSPGMSSSVAVAAEASGAEWLALCPCDMPLLTTATLSRLTEALGSYEGDVLQPAVAGRRKHPVFVRRAWLLHRAERLRGGTPLRDLLAEADGASVEFLDAAEFLDFDTPEEYEALMRLAHERGVE